MKEFIMPFDQEPIESENDHDSLEKPELQESELKKLLEDFRDALKDIPEIIVEMNTEMLLYNITPYERLGEHKNRAWEIIKDMFGFDINNIGSCSREYSIEGTPGSEGEGTIRVSLYKTNDSNIFVGQYEYPDGDKWWSLRPEKFAGEI